MRLLVGALCAACLLPASAQAPPAGTAVDVELVIAADVSQSMDLDEHTLQRKGYVEAFRQPDMIAAMLAGKTHRIAVAYVEFGDEDAPRAAIPWTIIDSQAAAAGFADHMAGREIRGRGRTSISNLLPAAVNLMETNDISSARRIVMVSGDGANASGPPVTGARDAAVKRGATIIGLPIMLNKPRLQGDIDDLDIYFSQCVAGGPNAFALKLTRRQDIADAISAAVSAKTPAGAVSRGQAGQIDCLVGEKALPKSAS